MTKGKSNAKSWRLVVVIAASVALPVACSASEQPATSSSSVSASDETSRSQVWVSTASDGSLTFGAESKAAVDLVFAIDDLITTDGQSRAAWAAGKSDGGASGAAGKTANEELAVAEQYPGLTELTTAARAVMSAEADTIGDLIQSKSVSASSEQALADALAAWEQAKASADVGF